MPAVATGAARPAVPATTLYDPQAVPPGWGAVIVGREPEKYDLGAIREHDAAGGVTFVYIDPVYLEPFGSTATRIHAGSTVMPGTTSRTALLDDALILRTRDEIRRIRERFATVKRLAIFSDDTGPDNPTFYPTAAARDQAYPRVVALMDMERAECDALGMRVCVNAVWDGRVNHGFPVRNQHGCGLADFLMSERHEFANTRPGDFWEAYLRLGQSNLKDASGRGMHFAICSTLAGGQDSATSPDIAFVSVQPAGTYARPGAKVGNPRDLGIPFGAVTPPPPPPPPPPSDPCGPVRLELAQVKADLAGSRDARDQAIARQQVLEGQLSAAVAANAALSERVSAAELERDGARVALAEASRDLEEIEGDLRKIRGSAGSSAGNAADRLRGVKGRATKALERRG